MSDEHTTEKDAPDECPRCGADSEDIGRERSGAWSCGECGLTWLPIEAEAECARLRAKLNARDETDAALAVARTFLGGTDE